MRTRPRALGRSLATAAVGAVGQVAGTGESGAGSRLTFSPAFAARDRCTAPIGVEVPLRRRGARARPGRVVIRALAAGLGRARDADRVTLVCDPAP